MMEDLFRPSSRPVCLLVVRFDESVIVWWCLVFSVLDYVNPHYPCCVFQLFLHQARSSSHWRAADPQTSLASEDPQHSRVLPGARPGLYTLPHTSCYLFSLSACFDWIGFPCDTTLNTFYVSAAWAHCTHIPTPTVHILNTLLTLHDAWISFTSCIFRDVRLGLYSVLTHMVDSGSECRVGRRKVAVSVPLLLAKCMCPWARRPTLNDPGMLAVALLGK